MEQSGASAKRQKTGLAMGSSSRSKGDEGQSGQMLKGTTEEAERQTIGGEGNTEPQSDITVDPCLLEEALLVKKKEDSSTVPVGKIPDPAQAVDSLVSVALLAIYMTQHLT